MVGLPILPVARYPGDAAVAFLPVQAAADPKLLENMRRHLKRGATLVLTPALVRALGPEGAQLAGVETGAGSEPVLAKTMRMEGESVDLGTPLELDAGLKAGDCQMQMSAGVGERQVPFLTSRAVGRGRIFVLNVRTFCDSDFGKGGEYLLAPRKLGLPRIPELVADKVRRELLRPLHVDLRGPAGVAVVLVGKEACFYNFRGEAARLHYQGELVELAAHECRWSKPGR
jgi:hypothetical protein